MSVGKISPGSRGLLRFHGWLLALWAAAIGLLTSALFLHVFHVQSMAVRYAVGAAAVYFIGFVFGGWWYVAWWNQRRDRMAADLPSHASSQQELEYNEAQEKIRSKFGGLDFLDVGGGGDDPLSALLLIVGVVILLVALLFFAGYVPMALTDVLAGYLAEIVLEFVIGAVIVRRVLRPRSMGGYWGFALRRTGLAGVAMVVVFGVAGFMLQSFDPTAHTLLQVFR